MILSYRVVDRLLRLVPAETGHRAAIVALRCGLVPAHGGDDDPVLASTVWGRRLANPVGLAAGFDKHAEAVVPAGRLGFAFVEIGSVTPRPQPGQSETASVSPGRRSGRHQSIRIQQPRARCGVRTLA